MRGQSLVLGLTVLVLSGCGGGGAPSHVDAGPAALDGTIAYVATECVDTLAGSTAHQQLRVIHGERPPMTLMDVPTLPPGSAVGICTVLGLSRFGPFFTAVGAFQRLAVSPDGERVVFEVTDQLSLLPLTPLPAEMEGSFVMRTDGTGLRRLGPASREPTFRFALLEENLLINVFPGFQFSPNGGLVAFTDRAPGSAGTDEAQVFTLDLATGQRTQLTRLPPAPTTDPLFPSTCCPGFIDDTTVGFLSVTNADGSNPEGAAAVFSVHTDGSGVHQLAVPRVAPGSSIIPVFSITGTRPSAALFLLPDEPVNLPGTRNGIAEVFVMDRGNLLQLTNFRRSDTSTPVLSSDGEQVFFVASADPFGRNATNNCQVFSIDRLGTDLQQITRFGEDEPSENGCFFGPPPGCALAFLGQDARTDSLIMYSSCDPFGNTPYGSQLFALRPDGSGLRQLTRLRGVDATEDQITVELPGPFAFSEPP